jgi:hypothetical protein
MERRFMISFIVPTICKPSLPVTLASIETLPGDEILLVGDTEKHQQLQGFFDHVIRVVHCEQGNDWGHTERNFATPLARGQYIAHIDDDDVYAPGTRALMQDAIERTPNRPVIFRMRFPNGITLWNEKVIRCGNLGTPCFLIPNRPEMMGTWMPFVGGDCAFLETSKWSAEDYVWREEIIALLGHNIG